MTQFSRTEKGALQYADSGNSLVDFLKSSAAQRKAVLDGNDNISELFLSAYSCDPKIAVKLAFWLRDARHGAGERAASYKIFSALYNTCPEFIINNLSQLMEIGYYKDLLLFSDNEAVLRFWAEQIRQGNRLAAKWAPRLKSQNKEVAKRLQALMGITAKEYRKLIKEASHTVEQNMCAQEWQGIQYEFVPSLAMHRYDKAFMRHDEKRFVQWTQDAKSKANASVIYPYQILQILHENESLAEKMWANLPNFLKPGERILPILDVSGSMLGHAIPGVTALAICVSLGLYLSERNLGSFQNTFVTFSTHPDIISLQGIVSLKEKIHKIEQAGWGYSTNFEKAYSLILETAQMYHVPVQEMPTMLLCLSDMQFDRASNEQLHLENIKQKFQQAGYPCPKLVFWNLREAFTGTPAMAHEDEVGLISGFSPSIMKAVLACQELTPINLVEKVVERYSSLCFDHLPGLDKLMGYLGITTPNIKKNMLDTILGILRAETMISNPELFLSMEQMVCHRGTRALYKKACSRKE